MSAIAKQDLAIAKGKTFQHVFRWEAPPVVYVPIQSISQDAPVEVTTQNPHAIPDGWRVVFQSVKGMTQLNAASNPPKDSEYYQISNTGANTFTINEVNSLDFKAHTAGTGVVRHNTAVDLTGYTARMSIRDKVGGTELISLTTVNNRIALDVANCTITLTISATDTAAITASKGVYDLEMVSATGVVTALVAGKVTISSEVTT